MECITKKGDMTSSTVWHESSTPDSNVSLLKSGAFFALANICEEYVNPLGLNVMHFKCFKIIT